MALIGPHAVEHLARDLDSLPAQQAVALRALQVSGDNRSSFVSIRSVVDAATLAARVLTS